MSVSNRRGRAGRCFFLCVVLIMVWAPLKAQQEQNNQVVSKLGENPPSEVIVSPPPIATTEWPETITVRQLLKMDTARAALNARQGWGASLTPQQRSVILPQPVPDLREPDRIHVSGIYGVGRHLHAEVVINGRTLHYAYGRLWPEGERSVSPNNTYALLAVEGRCLRLRKGAAIRTVCLKTNGEAP